MTIQKKPRKKQRAKLSPLKKLAALVILAICGYFIFQIGKTLYTTLTLKAQLKDAQEKLLEVQSENDNLTAEKSKLQDPDYVQAYARSNYNLSKQGEQIFYLPEDTDK